MGFAIFLRGHLFWHFAAAEFVLAIGTAFVSGSDESLLYESIPRNDRKRTTLAFANLQLAEQCGESSAALLGGFLATFSLLFAVWGQLMASVVVIVVALSLREPKRQISKSHSENFKRVLREVFVQDPILRLTFSNSVFWGLSTFFAIWTYQKHWQEVGVPLALFGVLWAAYNLSTGVVGKFVHSLEHRFGAKTLLLTMALSSCLAFFGMGIVSGYLSVLFGFLHYVSRGINGVLMSDAMNWRLNSDFRATANSLKSFAFRLGFAIFGPLVGWAIDRYSLNRVYIVLGSVFLLGLPTLLWPLIRHIDAAGKSEIPHA